MVLSCTAEPPKRKCSLVDLCVWHAVGTVVSRANPCYSCLKTSNYRVHLRKIRGQVRKISPLEISILSDYSADRYHFRRG